MTKDEEVAALALLMMRGALPSDLRPKPDGLYINGRYHDAATAVRVLAQMSKPVACYCAVIDGTVHLKCGVVEPEKAYLLVAGSVGYSATGSMGSEIKMQLERRDRSTVRIVGGWGEVMSVEPDRVQKAVSAYLLLEAHTVIGRDIPSDDESTDGFQIEIHPSSSRTNTIRKLLW